MFGTLNNLETLEHIAYTIECPWVGNKRGISCIPTGEYLCQYSFSPRFNRKLYSVEGVPNRTGIRIHRANYAGLRSLGLRCDLQGCIALGVKQSVVGGQRCIIGSTEAMAAFELMQGEQPFRLIIAGEFDSLEDA